MEPTTIAEYWIEFNKHNKLKELIDEGSNVTEYYKKQYDNWDSELKNKIFSRLSVSDQRYVTIQSDYMTTKQCVAEYVKDATIQYTKDGRWIF